MRFPSIPLITVLGSLAVYGSGERQTLPAALPRLAVAPESFDALTRAIDTTTTLGSWLKRYPDEVVSDSVPETDRLDPEVCLWTKTSVTIEGHAAVRWAQFNIPSPPAGEALPEDGPDLAARECRLRALWLEVEEPDSVRSHALATAIAGIIDARLGKSQPKLMIGTRGAGNWLASHTWKGPGTTVVLGIKPLEHFFNPESEEVDTSRVVKPRTVVVVAYTPFSGLDDTDDPNWDLWGDQLDTWENWGRTWALDNADSAIARIDIAPIATDLRLVIKTLRATRMFDSAPPSAHAALVRAAAAIHDRAPTLPPMQRAALLFAGDLVLQQAAPDFYTDTTKPPYRLYKALTAAGVEYGPEAYMVGYPYTRNWLSEAYRLDSLGTTGHAALLELLGTGWTTTHGCAENMNEIDHVIEHGEAAMRKGDIDPTIQFYVGLAYADRYRLARERFAQYAETQLSTRAAEEARNLGIERLRTSLLSLKPPHLRRQAWRRAVRLMLNLPTEYAYFCVMD